MAKKYYLINLLLLLVTAFLVNENYREWTSSPATRKEIVLASKVKTMLGVAYTSAEKVDKPAPVLFRSVSDKNIFNPNRTEFPVPMTPEPTKKSPLVRPNVQLFGVAVGEEVHSAVVTNPTRRADKGERETMTVKEGQRVGEYSVAKILPDRITLELSGDSFDVLLYDPTKPKKRPAVVSTTSPPSAPPIPPRPAVAATTTPPPPAPSPPAVSTTSPTPSRLYTPPARRDLPGRTITRPEVPRTTLPSAPARTLPVRDPGAEEEDDG